MDEATMRELAQAHAQAVVDPLDAERVAADLIPDLRPHLPEIAKLLPQPVTSAEVRSLQVQGDHAVVEIAYSGAEKTTTIRSRWEDRGAGQAQIVEAAPV
jgi:hypothetical protein